MADFDDDLFDAFEETTENTLPIIPSTKSNSDGKTDSNTR